GCWCRSATTPRWRARWCGCSPMRRSASAWAPRRSPGRRASAGTNAGGARSTRCSVEGPHEQRPLAPHGAAAHGEGRREPAAVRLAVPPRTVGADRARSRQCRCVVGRGRGGAAVREPHARVVPVEPAARRGRHRAAVLESGGVLPRRPVLQQLPARERGRRLRAHTRRLAHRRFSRERAQHGDPRSPHRHGRVGRGRGGEHAAGDRSLPPRRGVRRRRGVLHHGGGDAARDARAARARRARAAARAHRARAAVAVARPALRIARRVPQPETPALGAAVHRADRPGHAHRSSHLVCARARHQRRAGLLLPFRAVAGGDSLPAHLAQRHRGARRSRDPAVRHGRAEPRERVRAPVRHLPGRRRGQPHRRPGVPGTHPWPARQGQAAAAARRGSTSSTEVHRMIPKPRMAALVSVLVFLIAATVYFLTLTPTVPFWDSGEFIAVANILGVPHPPGTPFYVLLARIATLVPWATVAQRVNALSAVSAALTVWLTYLATLRLIRLAQGPERQPWHEWVAVASAATGALLLAFWENSVEAEVYQLMSLAQVLVFWLGLRWWEAHDKKPTVGPLLVATYIM